MRLETFFENFELLADAPNGVQKLLQKIRLERERLIEEKKLRKPTQQRLYFEVLIKVIFFLALRCDIVRQQFKEKTKQQAQPKLALKRIADAIIPVPPLEEQKRIVAKVDQLMALCEELEQRQQKRRESCVRLNNVAIEQLLTTRETDDFSKHWQRICDNFDLRIL